MPDSWNRREFAPFMTLAAEKGFGIADLEKITLETV